MKVTTEFGEELETGFLSPNDPSLPQETPTYNGVLSTDLPWLRQSGPLTHRHLPLDQQVWTADEAVTKVQSGHRVYIGGNCGEPDVLMAALIKRGDTLRNVEVIHVLTLGPVPYAEPEQEAAFRANVFYIGRNMRRAVNQGAADFTPVSLSELPRLFRDERAATVVSASKWASPSPPPKTPAW
jgi:hypothetical protein